MKRVVVLQSNYVPWKGYFDLINDADLFIYYDEVQYTKNDWRNRNRIYTPDGLLWLTIPIGKQAVKQKISEVEISDLYWQKKHFKMLYYGYKKSPYFHQLEPLLNEVYLDRAWKRLIDVNRYFIERICQLIGIDTAFADSKNYELKNDRVERLVNLLMQAQATVYISGPSARSYLSAHENLFSRNKIELVYKDYGGYPEYGQLHQPFIHNVSILDIIANVKLGEIKYYACDFRASGKGM